MKLEDMTLRDTVKGMCSDDPNDNIVAEMQQLIIRSKEVVRVINEEREKTVDRNEKRLEVYERTYEFMQIYLGVIFLRADVEGLSLETLSDE